MRNRHARFRGAKRPHQVLSADRFSATPFDFWGRSACGVCPGPKVTGTGPGAVVAIPDHRDHFAGAHREGRSLGEVSMAERGNSPVDSIFDGTDKIICEALDLCRQKLKQKTTCRKLSAALPAGFEAGIVSSLFKRIEDNWEQTKDNWEKSELKRLERDPSWESKNWQLRHQTEPDDLSESLETLLERAIAILAKLGELPDEWCNQISV